MANLRTAKVLSVSGMREIPLSELEQLVRPAGYFRQKAARLKNFVAFLDSHYRGSLAEMFEQPTDALRRELLALKGVGPETADSILLYAGNHPVFVVDTYTRRVAERHGILRDSAEYEDIRSLFERALRNVDTPFPSDRSKPGNDTVLTSGTAHSPSRVSTCKRSSYVQVCNEMHAFIVGLGKKHCFKRNPQCEGCPLQRFLQLKPGIAHDQAVPFTDEASRKARTSATPKSLK
jgi:endonuclease-3 related protein